MKKRTRRRKGKGGELKGNLVTKKMWSSNTNISSYRDDLSQQPEIKSEDEL